MQMDVVVRVMEYPTCKLRWVVKEVLWDWYRGCGGNNRIARAVYFDVERYSGSLKINFWVTLTKKFYEGAFLKSDSTVDFFTLTLFCITLQLYLCDISHRYKQS